MSMLLFVGGIAVVVLFVAAVVAAVGGSIVFTFRSCPPSTAELRGRKTGLLQLNAWQLRGYVYDSEVFTSVRPHTSFEWTGRYFNRCGSGCVFFSIFFLFCCLRCGGTRYLPGIYDFDLLQLYIKYMYIIITRVPVIFCSMFPETFNSKVVQQLYR